MSLLIYICLALLLPFLTLGIIQKTKARLQNRVGAPLLQPYFNLGKLIGKSQVISNEASAMFKGGTVFNFCAMSILLMALPWISISPYNKSLDLFLFLYLMAAARFFTVAAAMDSGSPFGAFSSGREVALAFLVEPAMVLCLLAPCLLKGTTNLCQAFSFSTHNGLQSAAVWLLAGAGLFLASLVELSRMPVDDPTTHLELTMVHEALIIENSGKNLALAEVSYAFKMTILWGLTVQCLLQSLSSLFFISPIALLILSILGIPLLAILVSLLETVLIRLKWTKCPDFIAFALTMGLFACLASLWNGI